MPSVPQMLAVGTAYDCTAPRRENTCRLQGQRVDGFFFNITKTGFTLAFEKLPYGATKALLYGMVRVNEGDLQPAGKLPPNGCFP